jgi:hypothetical protein
MWLRMELRSGVAAARDLFYVHLVPVPHQRYHKSKPWVKLVCSVNLTYVAIQLRMGGNI